MAATSTLRQILGELVERYGLGWVVTGATGGSGTTFTLTTAGSPELRGPFTGKRFPIGSPVVVSVETSGTTVLGDRSYISKWVPSTGVITLDPAIDTDTDGTELIILRPEFGDADRLIEAVNRALVNRISRWEPRPLTFVPDGDLQGATVTNYWTASAFGTAAYASAQVYPESTNDTVGSVGLNRVVQLTSSGGAATLTGNGIRWPLSSQSRQWRFWTAIRLVSGTGTVELKMRDNTNDADITLYVQSGADDHTLTTTTMGDFLVCEGTFRMPATCAEVAPQLSVSATGMVAQMTPIIMFPDGVSTFPLPNRIEAIDFIGNFYESETLRAPGSIADMGFYPTTPLTHRFGNYGDHLSVTFGCRITHPIWYEEQVSGTALSAMTDTTTFPLDQVVLWAYAELLDRMMKSEMLRGLTQDNNVPKPSIYRQMRNAAYIEAQNSVWEPALKKIYGRR